MKKIFHSLKAPILNMNIPKDILQCALEGFYIGSAGGFAIGILKYFI